MRKTLAVLALAPILSGMLSGAAGADIYWRHHDHVLGTSLDLVVNAPSEAAADTAESAIIQEIERLRVIFSTYDTSSEISRLNKASSMEASADMIRVLEQCEAYRTLTSNALSCRIGGLLDVWASAEHENRLPDRPAMRVAAGEIRRASIQTDTKTRRISRPEPVRFATDSLAKGYILDAALEVASAAAPEVSGLLINIGGDIRSWGDGPQNGQWAVAVTQASELGEGGSAPHARVLIDEGAIATSGLGPRNRTIEGEAYSHVISPADGWPVSHIQTATVHASDAMTADAIATALLVMDLKPGLDLVENMPGVEAEIVTADQRRHPTSGWTTFESMPRKEAEASANWPDEFTFTIDFEIPEQAIADYERPYVAVWIADKERNLIRILMLAGQQERWMEENYYWHRRFGRKAGSLVDAIAGPTRRPGQYDLLWDGLTDDGIPAPAGDYILHLEAAREHGDHQHESIGFTISEDPFTHQVEPGSEIGPIIIRFGVKD